MPPHKTVYLNIHKEKARRIITSDNQYLKVHQDKDDVIRMGYNKGSNSPSNNWRASLHDYKFEGEKIETPSGSVERGLLGTRMTYRHGKKSGRAAKKSVSKYIHNE
jgi:hypothetical protein